MRCWVDSFLMMLKTILPLLPRVAATVEIGVQLLMITHLRATDATWDHSVMRHPTQVNAPHLNPSQAGQYSIYLSWKDGKLSWWDTAVSAVLPVLFLLLLLCNVFFRHNVLNETSYLHYLLKSQERSQDIVNWLRSSQTYEHYSVRSCKLKNLKDLLSLSPLIIINNILSGVLAIIVFYLTFLCNVFYYIVLYGTD